MKRDGLAASIGVAALAVAAAVATASAVAAENDVAAARERAKTLVASGRPEDGILACSLCHGVGGSGDVNFAFGNLTGQSEDYFIKQLQAFKSGERQHRVMQRITDKLTADDMAALATYYAELEVAAPHRETVVVPEAGRLLAEQGDEQRGLPACESCHGAAAASDLTIANINGQHSSYLVNQLLSWQIGKRDDGSVMAEIAPKLTVNEIQSLAIYYASKKRSTSR